MERNAAVDVVDLHYVLLECLISEDPLHLLSGAEADRPEGNERSLSSGQGEPTEAEQHVPRKAYVDTAGRAERARLAGRAYTPFLRVIAVDRGARGSGIEDERRRRATVDRDRQEYAAAPNLRRDAHRLLLRRRGRLARDQEKDKQAPHHPSIVRRSDGDGTFDRRRDLAPAGREQRVRRDSLSS